jgi:hypothetical protein
MSRNPSSGKTFFIQYLIEYYMLLKKKVIYLLQQHDVQHQGLVQKLQLSTSCFIYNANDMSS